MTECHSKIFEEKNYSCMKVPIFGKTINSKILWLLNHSSDLGHILDDSQIGNETQSNHKLLTQFFFKFNEWESIKTHWICLDVENMNGRSLLDLFKYVETVCIAKILRTKILPFIQFNENQYIENNYIRIQIVRNHMLSKFDEALWIRLNHKITKNEFISIFSKKIHQIKIDRVKKIHPHHLPLL